MVAISAAAAIVLVNLERSLGAEFVKDRFEILAGTDPIDENPAAFVILVERSLPTMSRLIMAAVFSKGKRGSWLQ